MSMKVQSVAFLDYFSALTDPRQSWKVIYPLDEVLLLVLCGVLSGADGFVEIARWGGLKLDFLRRFLAFSHGVPSHDALNDLFNGLDHAAFRDAFVAWVESLRADGAEIVAIDGKTARRTGDRGSGRAPLHLVSAWAGVQRLVLGQEAVAGRENEIVAIPRLLEVLELKGALVTIDAIGCQTEIARAIGDKGADYLLALKGNQPALHQDVALFFEEQKDAAFADTEVLFHETTDNDHGRLEVRRHWSCSHIAWLKERHPWPGLASIGMIEAETEENGKTTTSRRFYIASLPADAVLLARAARAHWGIENRLHWVLDVVFHDDLCRLRTGNGPQNFAIVKHIAINMLKAAKGKHSLNVTRKSAAWDTGFLEKVITGSD